MCKHCGHAIGYHWPEDEKCTVTDCNCPGFEPSRRYQAVYRYTLTPARWSKLKACQAKPKPIPLRETADPKRRFDNTLTALLSINKAELHAIEDEDQSRAKGKGTAQETAHSLICPMPSVGTDRTALTLRTDYEARRVTSSTNGWDRRDRLLQPNEQVGNDRPDWDKQVRPWAGDEIDDHQRLNNWRGSDHASKTVSEVAEHHGDPAQTEPPLFSPNGMRRLRESQKPAHDVIHGTHVDKCENCVTIEIAPITIATVEPMERRPHISEV
ncbi:MAG: hypothetical protein IPJ98_15475 [Bryobacterales bacterium]|nr:hypothetical protein [Bryobacterales bacterium]